MAALSIPQRGQQYVISGRQVAALRHFPFIRRAVPQPSPPHPAPTPTPTPPRPATTSTLHPAPHRSARHRADVCQRVLLKRQQMAPRVAIDGCFSDRGWDVEGGRGRLTSSHGLYPGLKSAHGDAGAHIHRRASVPHTGTPLRTRTHTHIEHTRTETQAQTRTHGQGWLARR